MGDHEADGREDLIEDPLRPVTEGDQAAQAVEAGRLLFARECRFVVGAAGVRQVPATGLPEVCFAGRSNVGKSSLINALTGRTALARVSVTPGRTQQINFFDLGGRLMLADLPGYGYAKAPKQQVANWTKVVELYLIGRAPLRRALLLIDSRHGPKDSDRAVMALLDKAAVAYQVVLTKTDHLRPAELAERVVRTADELSRHPAAHPEVLPTSAQKDHGIIELRAALATLVA